MGLALSEAQAVLDPLDMVTGEARPYVEKHGGKIGLLEYHRENNPAVAQNILPTHIVPPGAIYEGNGYMKGELIARASHPIDVHAMVGAMDTKMAPSSDEAVVNGVIGEIRQQVSSPEVVQFASYSTRPGAYLGSDVTIGVQPFVNGMRASVVSHPNRPRDKEEFVISWFQNAKTKSTDSLASGIETYSGIFNARGKLKTILTDKTLGFHAIQKNISPQVLIDLYERVRNGRALQDDRTFLMEAVADENDLGSVVKFCQQRDFRKREVADWRINPSTLPIKFELPKLVFGITPKEGIELTVVQSPDCLLEKGGTEPLGSLDEPWALLKTQHQTEPPLSFQPTNMRAYLGGFRFGSGAPSLAHMQESFAAKADVAVFENPQKQDRQAYHREHDDYYDPRVDFDFSRRIVAEMIREAELENPLWPGETKFGAVRSASNLGLKVAGMAQDTMINMLEATRGRTYKIRLFCDGYTAYMEHASDQPSSALRRKKPGQSVDE